MKRYFLFAGDAYYPQAGMVNFIEDCDDIDEIVEKANLLLRNRNCFDWAVIWDSENRTDFCRLGEVDVV